MRCPPCYRSLFGVAIAARPMERDYLFDVEKRNGQRRCLPTARPLPFTWDFGTSRRQLSMNATPFSRADERGHADVIVVFATIHQPDSDLPPYLQAKARRETTL